MTIPSPEQVDELPESLGVHLVQNHKADAATGHLQMVGWAGYFDTTNLTGMLDQYSAVIVAVWPPEEGGENKMQVEGFTSDATAGWRYLMWDDVFRMSPMPEDDDVIIWYDNNTHEFVLGSLRVKKWKRLQRFLARKLDGKRQIWFSDHEIGNYYLWEL